MYQYSRTYIYADRLNELYQFIVDFKIANDGNSPNTCTISKALNIVPSQVAKYLRVLHREGRITLTNRHNHPLLITVRGGRWSLE